MNKKIYIITIFILLISLLTSCVSRNKLLQEVDNLTYENKFKEAKELLAQKKDDIYSKKKDKALFLLDTGLLTFYAKDINTSKANLQEAEKLMEEYRVKSIGESLGSFIINDTVKTYEGESYEYIFTNIILSLGYLMQKDFDGGFVEIRRAQEKIKKLQNDYNIRLEKYNKDKEAKIKLDASKYAFVDSAFLRLLSFWLYRADNDFTNMEVAARKYNEAIINQPSLYSFNPPLFNVDNVLKQKISQKRIQIVALTGRIPFKISHHYLLNTVENGITFTKKTEKTPSFLPSNIEVHKSPGTEVIDNGAVIPFLGIDEGAKIIIDLPFIAKIRSKIEKVNVIINDTPSGTLQKTESLENIAINVFDVESPLIYARTIIRAISKMIIGAELGQAFSTIIGKITQLISNLTERADLRSARYFPAYIWTADVIVPQKEKNTNIYNVELIYKDKNNNILYKDNKKINIHNQGYSLPIIVSSFLQ